MSYKAKIIQHMTKLHVNSPDKSNIGGILADAYMWDVIAHFAEGKKDAAWKTLVSEKFIPTDDFIRENVNGKIETLVKSDNFIVEAEVKSPRNLFDKEGFIEVVSKEFRIPKHKLVELSKQCVSQTRAPLTKRVVEI